MVVKYSIVRADGKVCSRCENSIIYKNGKVGCKIGADIKNGCKIYGDTKEQMIKKVVQVMLRRFKRMYKGKFITVEMAEKQYLEVAKEIVEFLGVK